jgi:hypothetical protein
MNESLPIPGIISLVVALQFAAFGWRINREISVGDKGEKTWLPLTDRVNFLSMFLTLTCCILLPLFLGRFSRLSMSVFGFSSVLIFWHPISMAAHYELLAGRAEGDMRRKLLRARRLISKYCHTHLFRNEYPFSHP